MVACSNTRTNREGESNDLNAEEFKFHHAHTLVATLVAVRLYWWNMEACFAYHKMFGLSQLRHHCHLCGKRL